MSTLVWSEHTIARAISTQTLAKKCVVLVDNCNWTGYECDVLAVTTDLRIIDVEVKISRADLKADAKKDKWWHRSGSWRSWAGETQPDPIARMHPPKVWKHYYALPKEIWKPELLDCLPSKASGVLLLREPRDWREPAVVVECIRRSTPAKDAYRLQPEQVMDIARLANLRMWDAYHREETARAEAQDYYHGRRQVLTPYHPPEAA
jgi:hypothetical protein